MAATGTAYQPAEVPRLASPESGGKRELFGMESVNQLDGVDAVNQSEHTSNGMGRAKW